MSIATKTGDGGTTGLLFGSRVSKADQIIAAVGDIDELNAAIGMAKAFVFSPYTAEKEMLETVQRKLTLLMGEVAAEDTERYTSSFDCIKEADLEKIDQEIARLESIDELKQKDWILYGNSLVGSRCDFASKVCRRAERSVVAIETKKTRPLLLKYINRLSDMLHLYGRLFDHAEKQINQQ